MKQHINSEQLDELTDRGRKFLQEWYTASEGDLIAYKGNPRQKQWLIRANSEDTEWGYDVQPGKRLTGKWELPALYIGQMIHFLYQRETMDIHSEERNSPNQGWYVNSTPALELCDALWQRVRDICNK